MVLNQQILMYNSLAIKPPDSKGQIKVAAVWTLPYLLYSYLSKNTRKIRYELP